MTKTYRGGTASAPDIGKAKKSTARNVKSNSKKETPQKCGVSFWGAGTNVKNLYHSLTFCCACRILEVFKERTTMTFKETMTIAFGLSAVFVVFYFIAQAIAA